MSSWLEILVFQPREHARWRSRHVHGGARIMVHARKEGTGEPFAAAESRGRAAGGRGGAVQGVPVKAAALRFIEEWIYSLVQAHLEVQPTKSIMTEMKFYRLKCWRFYVRRLRVLLQRVSP